jgi:hypothetical protein
MRRWSIGVVLALAGTWPLTAQDSDEFLTARINQSTDIAWLESLVTNTGAAPTLLASVQRPVWGRQAAYFRLGAIGDSSAFAALDKIEARAKASDLVPANVPLSNAGISGAMQPLESFFTVEHDGTAFAIFGSLMLGGPDLFIASSRTPEDLNSWTRPRLTGVQWRDQLPWSDVALRWLNPGRIELTFKEGPARAGSILGFFPSFGGLIAPPPPPPPPVLDTPTIPITTRTVTIDLADVERDSDADGWSDLEEHALGLDPRNPDTDGDGAADGRDTCPDLARPQPHKEDTNADMIARAFFAVRGFSASRRAMVMRDGSVHLFGYSAPIVSRLRPGSRFDGAMWSIEGQTDTSARVWVFDGQGEAMVELNRKQGRWIALRIPQYRISSP